MSLRRIQKEIIAVEKAGLGTVTQGDNTHELTVHIVGPEDTPYHNRKIPVHVVIDSNHPFKPPKCKFPDGLYHPNVDAAGTMCLGILKSEWSPVKTLSDVISHLLTMLQCPNLDDPLMPEIAKQYREDYDGFCRCVSAH